MLRSYDPQIGRFLQNDPYDQFSSGYVGMGNDPGSLVDPSGGSTEPFSTLGNVIVTAKAKAGTLVKGFSMGQQIISTTTSIFRYANVAGEIFETTKDLNPRHIDPETGEMWWRQDWMNTDPGTITQYKPDFFDKWSESDNFFAQTSYGIVDGTGLFIQAMTPGIGHQNAKHLNGSVAYGNEVLEAGLSTMASFVPGANLGKGFGILKWSVPSVGKQAVQIIGRAASSKILSKNLLSVGMLRPINSAAHHIVAGSDRRAKIAREILKKAGIDINDASNGVFIPASSKFAGSSIPHSKIHTNKYYKEVNKRLQNASDIKAELQNIREDILSGLFPY